MSSPATISVTVLPRMARRAAHALFLTGETIDATRAAAVGLIDAAVPPDRLDAEVGRYVDMLRRGAPGALAATKALLHRPPATPATSTRRSPPCRSSRRGTSRRPEGQEGMAAFAENARRPGRPRPTHAGRADRAGPISAGPTMIRPGRSLGASRRSNASPSGLAITTV